MTKTTINYNNAVIYKIHCKNIDIKDIYVGSTTNFRQRKARHKCNCINENVPRYNLNLYKCIRNNGDWDNWNMSVIEEYKCDNKLELHKRERYYIETLHATLNMSVPCQTKKEWCVINKDKIKQQNKEYYETNKDLVIQRTKEWFQKNKHKLIRVKITCECGAVINRNSMTKHKKTEKHKSLMDQLTPALK